MIDWSSTSMPCPCLISILLLLHRVLHNHNKILARAMSKENANNDQQANAMPPTLRTTPSPITWYVVKLCSNNHPIWRRYQNFRVTGHLCVEFTGHRLIPRTKASDPELWFFLDMCLNEQLSKQSWGRWFVTPFCPFWCHSNEESGFLGWNLLDAEIMERNRMIVNHLYLTYMDEYQ